MPHCLRVSFFLNNKPLLEKAGLVRFISDYCCLLDSSLLTSVPQSLRRLRISVSNALPAGREALDAPLSMTAALYGAAGERLSCRQQNRSACCAAFRGFASSRREQPMSSAHCLEQINSQNFSRLALHLHSHCCEPKIVRMIFSTSERSLRVVGTQWLIPVGGCSGLAPWDRAGTSQLLDFKGFFYSENQAVHVPGHVPP